MSSDDENDGDVGDLMETLDDVDESAPDADLNESTIDDNDGGRIELGDDADIKK